MTARFRTRREVVGMAAALAAAPKVNPAGDPVVDIAREWLSLHGRAVAAWQRCHEARAEGLETEGRAAWELANELSNSLEGLAYRLETTSAASLAGAILRVEVAWKLSLFDQDPLDPLEMQEHRILMSAMDDFRRLVPSL